MSPDPIGMAAAPTPWLPVPAPRNASRSAEPQPGGEAPPPQVDVDDLEATQAAINRALQQKGMELAFEFDDAVNRVVSKLIDRETGEVIRQVPSETVRAIALTLADGAAAGAVVQALA